MSMTLSVPDEIADAAREMAKGANATAEELMLQALRAHFPAVSPELQAEFDAWNHASDEDFARLAERENL